MKHHLRVFYREKTLEGKTIGTKGIGVCKFAHPRGITLDHQENILVADSQNHRIQVVTIEGEYLSGFGTVGDDIGSFNTPYDVAVDKEGNIIVADTKNHRLQVFSRLVPVYSIYDNTANENMDGKGEGGDEDENENENGNSEERYDDMKGNSDERDYENENMNGNLEERESEVVDRVQNEGEAKVHNDEDEEKNQVHSSSDEAHRQNENHQTQNALKLNDRIEEEKEANDEEPGNEGKSAKNKSNEQNVFNTNQKPQTVDERTKQSLTKDNISGKDNSGNNDNDDQAVAQNA